MKREIKFRALCDADDKKRQMIYFEAQEFDNGIQAWPVSDEIFHIDSYESPLMQYTGLKDKNGIEIYEGDIVKSGKSEAATCALIVFKQQAFLLKYLPIEKKGNEQIYDYMENYKYFEIKGNIYENPELIKQ